MSKHDVRNLTLLGAWFISSANVQQWPVALQQVMDAAAKEMTTHLETEQYSLFQRSDSVEVVPHDQQP